MSPPTVLAIRFEAPISHSANLGQLLRNEARLKVSGELQLVAVVDLVDELHREERPDGEERDEEPAVVEEDFGDARAPDAAADLFFPSEARRALQREDEGDEGDGEQHPPRRREPPREAEEHGVRLPKKPPDPPARAIDLLLRFRGQLGEGVVPVAAVEAGEVLAAHRPERRFDERDPVLSRRHSG